MLEISATVFGLIQGTLVMFDKRSNWIFYSLQMLFLVAFSVNVHLWGDVLIDCVYFVLGIVGFFLWKKGNRCAGVSALSRRSRFLWTLFAIISVAVAYIILRRTDNPLPLLDSVTSVTSVIATWLMFSHKLDTWVVWFVNDLFYIVEYIMLPDRAFYLTSLYIVWTMMAILSFIGWLKIYSRSLKVSES